MRRLLFAIVLAAATAGVVSLPAHADRPATFTDSFSFDEPNPCDPSQTQTTTLQVEFAEHVHRNNVVVNVAIDASTSTGFSGSGHETQVFTSKVTRFSQQVMLANPDTGQRYKVGGAFVMTPDGRVVVDSLTLTCLR